MTGEGLGTLLRRVGGSRRVRSLRPDPAGLSAAATDHRERSRGIGEIGCGSLGRDRAGEHRALLRCPGERECRVSESCPRLLVLQSERQRLRGRQGIPGASGEAARERDPETDPAVRMVQEGLPASPGRKGSQLTTGRDR